MGGLTTDDTYENPRSHVNHNHPADRTGVEVTKLRTTMKAVAKQSRSRPNQILTQALLEASDEVRANIGKIQTCKRDLQRQRRGCLPNDPATLPELVIPDEWTLTGGADPRPFLIHDSGPGQRQRVVVYAAEGQLRHLGQSDTWFMDVDGLRRDYALVSTQLLQHTRGQLIKKRQRRSYVELQKRLQTLCQDFVAECRSLADFLSAVGHCIRLE
ncbi:hypothetical protein LSAT2_015756 [Lamellibrachia satsuma]|nr:hypothetical protein LSAT2_015756 [Lamellibrachia satsuma]